MTLTQNGIDYICQNFGDVSECCVSSGLQWEWEDIDGNTGVENGGTGAAVGTLILAQLIVKITMLNPPRGDFTYQQLRTANDGTDLTFADVDQILLNDGDPPGENQWCYIAPPPCSSYTNQVDCEANNCYWYNEECHTDVICEDIDNQPDCERVGCYWWNNACHDSSPTSCDQLNNQTDCELYYCYWYDGSCHSSPVPCSSYTNQVDCEANNCYWWNDTCHDSSPTSCDQLNNQTDCEWYYCYWYDGACHSDPQYPCDHWTNAADCEANNCYWYDGACHSKLQEIPWLLYAGIATVVVGGIAVIIKRRGYK